MSREISDKKLLEILEKTPKTQSQIFSELGYDVKKLKKHYSYERVRKKILRRLKKFEEIGYVKLVDRKWVRTDPQKNIPDIQDIKKNPGLPFLYLSETVNQWINEIHENSEFTKNQLRYIIHHSLPCFITLILAYEGTENQGKAMGTELEKFIEAFDKYIGTTRKEGLNSLMEVIEEEFETSDSPIMRAYLQFPLNLIKDRIQESKDY